MKGILIAIVFVALVSCSKQGPEEECPITVDAVTIVDTIEQGGVSYYLVHRIAGWNDKTEILELYDRKPTFDHCSRSNVEPIFGDSLEMDQTISHVYLNTKEEVLEIEYKKGEPDKVNPGQFRLELRKANNTGSQ